MDSAAHPWLAAAAALLLCLLELAVLLAKDRAFAREYLSRRREAKRSAVVLHNLLRRQAREPVPSLPDFGDDSDVDTGVINVRDELEQLASRELDSDLEALIAAYHRDIDAMQGRTPHETPRAKRRRRP